MSEPIKIIDLELTRPREDIDGLEAYSRVRCLVRYRGVPVGWLERPVTDGLVRLGDLSWKHLKKFLPRIFREAARQRLVESDLSALGLFAGSGPDISTDGPTLTIAVCTHDRTDSLAHSLEAISKLNYQPLEILVIDNAPSDDRTRQLVSKQYPGYRYILEERPGLDWARNRAINEANGEIIAYTDDDTTVDPGWAAAIASVFAGEPEVMALTGLVVPLELETRAQNLFEANGGFGRGFERRWVRVDPLDRRRWTLYGTGQHGTGANMAFRKNFLESIGGFDPALDVGTVTHGGGDLEIFYRAIRDGHLLVYEPRAIVRHRHRRDYDALRRQIANNGTGLISYFIRSCADRPRDRLMFTRLMWWWLTRWYLRRLLRSYRRSQKIPRDLIQDEFIGFLKGLRRYSRARKTAQKLAFGDSLTVAGAGPGSTHSACTKRNRDAMAVRVVDLELPLLSIDDISDFRRVRLEVFRGDRYLGNLVLKNHYCHLGSIELTDHIARRFGLRLVDADRQFSRTELRALATARFSKQIGLGGSLNELGAVTSQKVTENRLLRGDVSVSIVIATLDRPDALRLCLRSLHRQDTYRPVEIVVVDNNPFSGLTKPVLDEFPEVVQAEEAICGLSYARNRGIITATGQIIVSTDDDVTFPAGWLETLLRPFARADVVAVTGNVLPLHLDSRASVLFEVYGGLGRGAKPLTADSDWMASFSGDAVPTWHLGATANAAFRSSIFSDREIGLLEEVLGPGTPTGVGEDTDLFYRVLRAGHSIVYQPDAYVWHDHRKSMKALRQQIYAYSKGHIAYNLFVAFRYGDTRSLRRVFIILPLWRLRQSYRWLRDVLRRRRPSWPLSLVLTETAGNLAGPWGLMRSIWRVRRLGRIERSYVEEMPDTKNLTQAGGHHVIKD